MLQFPTQVTTVTCVFVMISISFFRHFTCHSFNSSYPILRVSFSAVNISLLQLGGFWLPFSTHDCAVNAVGLISTSGTAYTGFRNRSPTTLYIQSNKYQIESQLTEFSSNCLVEKNLKQFYFVRNSVYV